MTATLIAESRQEEQGCYMANEWPLFSYLGPLGALLTAPRVARMYTRLVLAEWRIGTLADTAELIVSELVTNAVQVSTGPAGLPAYDADGRLPVIYLRLLSDRILLRIEVWDQMPEILGTPIARETDEYNESGRGLTIVESASERFGFSSVPGWPGKYVWSELRVLLIFWGAESRRSLQHDLYQRDPDRGGLSRPVSGV